MSEKRGAQFLDRSEPVNARQTRIGIEITTGGRRAKDAFDGVLENRAIFFFGLTQRFFVRAPPRNVARNRVNFGFAAPVNHRVTGDFRPHPVTVFMTQTNFDRLINSRLAERFADAFHQYRHICGIDALEIVASAEFFGFVAKDALRDRRNINQRAVGLTNRQAIAGIFGQQAKKFLALLYLLAREMRFGDIAGDPQNAVFLKRRDAGQKPFLLSINQQRIPKFMQLPGLNNVIYNALKLRIDFRAENFGRRPPDEFFFWQR